MLGETFFNHFTPLIYPPGSMGHFLMHFLLEEHHKTENPNLINVTAKSTDPLKTNYEWLSNDVVECIFGTAGYQETPIYKKIKKHYTNESEETILKIYIRTILLLKYTFNLPSISWEKYFNNEEFVLNSTNETKKLNEIIRIPLSRPFQIPDNILLSSFKYLKFHHYPYRLPTQNTKTPIDLKFQNKVYARFSKNRTWLPMVLGLYKYITHFEKVKTKHNKHLITGIELKQYINYFIEDYTENLLFDLDSNEKLIDMDKLIIDQNVSDIYNIEPNFKFTEAKRAELQYAHETTIKIITELDLDLWWDSSTMTIHDVLQMGKIKELINRGLARP